MVLPDRIELSTSPLPMECSTTELRQHARGSRIGPEGPVRRAVLATRACLAQARGCVPGPPKSAKSGLRRFWPCDSADSGPIGSISLGRPASRSCSGRSNHIPGRIERDAARPRRVGSASASAIGLFLATGSLFELSGMNDDRDKRGGPPGRQDSRQERLKLALRENLKRRKSQARGRSDAPPSSSEDADAALDDASGKEPGP